MAATTKTTDQATRDAIHRALPGPKQGDQWATARAVADAVGKAYSTVTEHLRAMVEDGSVGMDKHGRANVYRKTAGSPKLKATDAVTPAATPVVKGNTKDGTRRALAPKPALPKRRRAPVTRSVQTVELPAANVEPATEPVPDAPASARVWMSTRRKGLNYHALASALKDSTACGRSTRTGVLVDLADVRDTSPFCPVCKSSVVGWLDDDAKPADPVAVPQPPAAANTPTGGDLGAVVGFMESVRPVSAPPAEPEKKARRPRAGGAPKTYAVFGRGELQDAILSHVQGLPAGTDATPYQVATALKAYPGAVAYGLGRLVVKGNVVKTSDQPQRFAAA